MVDFIGNELITARINHALKSGRLPHALIFAGPDGVGKKRLALELAKCLNCGSRPMPCGVLDACAACPSCKKIAANLHPDVRFFGPEENYIRIDQMRQLCNDVYLRPFEARKRVFVIDQAERMNVEAAHSILKTLEEPPDTVTLILITTNVDALLPTIRSRCHLFQFNVIKASLIEERLRGKVSDEDARLAAKLAQGSVSKAVALDLTEYRKLRKEVFLAVKDLISLKDLHHSTKMAQDLSKDKKGVEAWLRLIYLLLRDLIVLKHSEDHRLLINSDITVSLRNLATLMSLDQLYSAVEGVVETQRALEKNANRQLALEVLLLKLMRM